ncbi:MAG: hypothetical protein B7Y59_09385 [Burkholderiales bacterium 35-55-47]|jgi:hypothetical protein|uniref:hypothetical protein n=1 Tax=Limnohabitans sp. TaxID=1907725 RepID=UPI000BCC264F|nr:hypothetical protein [Limnohabitans sp.]OYY18158.1 MAG: hypothetical protein B7Y59_09385 [Burkholderiales bacterium 35-55-47]OYZ72571.1 MAG: hypothetical protein B7Y06_10090 [Burkholderiales bacterium 24-55-52]OZB00024.1 MAG: hypothetical protein B7X62_08575 [Burkholderiales bacterium 39-55-53]HQR87033.1 hypothetical protein [Limnohabitans sp.]HQS26869.1 hypothetical protein [Limnohabitans sp.]
MWTFSRACLGSLVVLTLAGVNFSACAADLSAQDRLNAIRGAMVEAAMKSNTRVSATSWMESDGKLRELNRFSSEIKLRDLQVAQYVRDAGQQPQAELVSNQSIEIVQPGRCEAPQAKSALRQIMTVDLDLSTGLAPAQRYQAQQLGVAARKQLMQSAARSERWRLIGTLPQSNTYDRLQYGQGEEHVQWHAQLSVTPVPLGGVSDDFSAFGLTLQVNGPGQRQVWFVAEQVVVPSLPIQAYGTPKMDTDTNAAIARAVNAMADQLDKQLACEPQAFTVSQANGRLSLNAGTNAGLRVGDKLMIADPSVLPRHTLEPGALDAAVLAEVKSVTPYQAEIKQVAGRKQKFNGAWVAWPYTY